MLTIDMEFHLFDALGHVLASLDSWTVLVLALHRGGHDEAFDEDLDDLFLVPLETL